MIILLLFPYTLQANLLSKVIPKVETDISNEIPETRVIVDEKVSKDILKQLSIVKRAKPYLNYHLDGNTLIFDNSYAIYAFHRDGTAFRLLLFFFLFGLTFLITIFALLSKPPEKLKS
jgi:hypothetical protein